MTRCEMEWSFDCHNVNKILYTYWLSKKILKFYHVKAHIISFPTMYNTWGLREWEPKTPHFEPIYRPFFPNYLTSRRSGEISGIANLPFLQSHSHGMVFSFKMSHQEAWSGNNCWSYGWYCETCHWPWKSPKKSLFCLKCKMFQLFCILDFFGFHHWKVEITSFPNMYNTYRVTVKLRQLHPGEKWEVWKIWNVNKNRRC